MIVRETPAGAENSLDGTWVGSRRRLITEREALDGAYRHLGASTPAADADYSGRFNAIYENAPPPAESFSAEAYERQLEETLKAGGRPDATGKTKIVRGKRAREYRDTLPAKAKRPEADVTLYVDAATDLVLREEYELTDPESGATVNLVRERMRRGQVPQGALLTPEEIEGVAERERRERIARAARLPYAVPWVAERFGNLELAKMEVDDFWVRLDYASLDDPGGPEVLSVIVQEVDGASTEEVSANPERSVAKTTPEGRQVGYEVGPAGPDGERTELAAFERGGAKVLVQKRGDVRGEGGEYLDLLEAVDDMRAVE